MTQPESPLRVRRFVCSGHYAENCYVLSDRLHPPDCLVIDPGAGLGAVIDYTGKEKLTPVGVLLTHGHLDHIAGLPEAAAAWPDAPILIGRAEGDAPQSPQRNLSAAFGLPLKMEQRASRLLDGGEELTVGRLTIHVLPTPGHSLAGLCFHCPAGEEVFTGDVLFAGSVGRSDIPGADGEALIRSIREQLLPLPPSTRVRPGHGPASTIGEEIATNPFLTTR